MCLFFFLCLYFVLQVDVALVNASVSALLQQASSRSIHASYTPLCVHVSYTPLCVCPAAAGEFAEHTRLLQASLCARLLHASSSRSIHAAYTPLCVHASYTPRVRGAYTPLTRLCTRPLHASLCMPCSSRRVTSSRRTPISLHLMENTKM